MIVKIIIIGPDACIYRSDQESQPPGRHLDTQKSHIRNMTPKMFC